MASEDVVETLHGKRCKFEIVRRDGGFLSATKFFIYRDGELYKGSFSTLSAAVDAIQREL